MIIYNKILTHIIYTIVCYISYMICMYFFSFGIAILQLEYRTASSPPGVHPVIPLQPHFIPLLCLLTDQQAFFFLRDNKYIKNKPDQVTSLIKVFSSSSSEKESLIQIVKHDPAWFREYVMLFSASYPILKKLGNLSYICILTFIFIHVCQADICNFSS